MIRIFAADLPAKCLREEGGLRNICVCWSRAAPAADQAPVSLEGLKNPSHGCHARVNSWRLVLQLGISLMKWVMARDKQDREVWLNLSAATSLVRGDKYTHVYFAGSEDDKVDVKEAPEDLLKSAGVEVDLGHDSQTE